MRLLEDIIFIMLFGLLGAIGVMIGNYFQEQFAKGDKKKEFTALWIRGMVVVALMLIMGQIK